MNNNKKERKILVTGATGTVGSEVVKQLVSVLTYSQVAEIISGKVGRKITYIDINEDTAKGGLKQIGYQRHDGAV